MDRRRGIILVYRLSTRFALWL